MAGASLFLPFLPLLPKQVLLINLFTDCGPNEDENDRACELPQQERQADKRAGGIADDSRPI